MTTVRYPAKAARALGFLKSHSNDVDIFVEDSAAPNMWVKLLRKFLPAGTKLASVTPLGGRNEVIKACRADQRSGGRRRLYIIDADMDLLYGRAKPQLKHLYRLRRYCVENYLISQDALTEVLMSLHPALRENDARATFGVSEWLADNKMMLRSIFLAYAVSQKLEIGSQTVSYSCHRLFPEKGNFNYCPHRVGVRVFSIYREAVRSKGIHQVRSTYDLVTRNAELAREVEYCSAKSYIFPAIYGKLKLLLGLSVGVDAFKTLFCDHVNPSVDPYLRRRLACL